MRRKAGYPASKIGRDERKNVYKEHVAESHDSVIARNVVTKQSRFGLKFEREIASPPAADRNDGSATGS